MYRAEVDDSVRRAIGGLATPGAIARTANHLLHSSKRLPKRLTTVTPVPLRSPVADRRAVLALLRPDTE